MNRKIQTQQSTPLVHFFLAELATQKTMWSTPPAGDLALKLSNGHDVDLELSNRYLFTNQLDYYSRSPALMNIQGGNSVFNHDIPFRKKHSWCLSLTSLFNAWLPYHGSLGHFTGVSLLGHTSHPGQHDKREWYLQYWAYIICLVAWQSLHLRARRQFPDDGELDPLQVMRAGADGS